MSNKLDFEFLNDQFLTMGAISSPSELQGVLVGVLVVGGAPKREAWVKDAIKYLDLEIYEVDAEQRSVIEGLFDHTVTALAEDNFVFSPLQPGEDATLRRRAQELGVWCEGFLHGIGRSGMQGEQTLSADVAEILRDLAKISQIDFDADDEAYSEEEGEANLVELVEYVKVAVLNIQIELNSPESSEGSSDNTVH